MVVVYTKGLREYEGLVMGGIVGLDIFFFAFISGASMNPVRSLAPVFASGVLDNIWLYGSATFIGTSIVALRKKFANEIKDILRFFYSIIKAIHIEPDVTFHIGLESIEIQ